MSADVILVGGGLANCLIAYRLRQQSPDLAITVIEQGTQLGGNHLWSFHDSDLSAEQRAWIEPLITASWRRHEVRFPAHRRTLGGGYSSMSSETLDQEVRRALSNEGSPAAADHAVLTETEASKVEPGSVALVGGRQLEAPLVIDGRGPAASEALILAYQKFLGLEVDLEAEHGLTGPVLMDATVDQLDGYRFIYTLPMTSRTMLIEDTRYSDGPDLDPEAMRREIRAYAERAGWTIEDVRREEQGVLPIALGGDIEAFWSERRRALPCSGLRAALFHPTTGYSLPDAVRLADEIASMRRPRSEEVYESVRRRSTRQWKAQGFFRLLNRMLFHAAPPAERYKVLQRFYRLPEPLIQRFYAGRPTAFDRVRVLTGRPPVPLRRALRCLRESAVRPVVEARQSP